MMTSHILQFTMGRPDGLQTLAFKVSIDVGLVLLIRRIWTNLFVCLNIADGICQIDVKLQAELDGLQMRTLNMFYYNSKVEII